MFLMFTTRLGVWRYSFIEAEEVRTAGQDVGLTQRARAATGFLDGRRIGKFNGLH